MSDYGILVVAQGVMKAAVQHLLPQSAGFASNVSEVQPRNAHNRELWDESGAAG